MFGGARPGAAEGEWVDVRGGGEAGKGLCEADGRGGGVKRAIKKEEVEQAK